MTQMNAIPTTNSNCIDEYDENMRSWAASHRERIVAEVGTFDKAKYRNDPSQAEQNLRRMIQIFGVYRPAREATSQPSRLPNHVEVIRS